MDGVFILHVRGKEEAECFGAVGGGITKLLPVSVFVDGREGASRVLREDPRLIPLNQLPLGLQDVGHEVGSEDKSAFCWAVVPVWSPTTMLPSSL